MLPASRSGNTSTFARPATAPTSFNFLAATAGLNAASACSSPSIASSGARARAISSARTTLSTCACAALPLVENDSSATRGSSRSTRRQLSAEESAMSASASGDRIGVHRAIGEDRARDRANSITKKLDGVLQPGARPTVSIPASITRAVVLAAPATIASASPVFTIRPAWNSGFAARRRAIFGFASGRPSR